MCSSFVLMGLLMLAQVGVDALRSDASAEWPTAFGTVVSVQVDELERGDDIYWLPRVAYQYQVHGRTMIDTQLTPGQQPHWRDRAEAVRFLDRYVPRSRVLVYFNPDKVNEAVLEPTRGGPTQPMLGLGLLLTALGFWCLVIYDRLR